MSFSGQGIRVRIELEDTNTGKTIKVNKFLPLPAKCSLSVAISSILSEAQDELEKDFKETHLQDLEKLYYSKEKDNASN